MINGDAVTSDSRDYQAVAIIRKKVDASSLVWRLLTGAPALDESIHSDKDEFDRQYEPYTITFDSIARENIDFIRFKFTLHDENDQLRALYYAKLEHLFKSSKRGKDVTLNLGTSPEGVGHLLHLAVTSHRLDHLQKKSSYMSKFLSQDYVQDINFNYSFSFPKITPRSSKLLALLPESWKVIDEGLMSNHRSGDLGAWIQRVKYRLARHYHRNSSKHLAKLEQTNILWANLQDELAQYSLEKPAGSEDIFIDEVSLEKILEPYQPRRFNSPTGTSGTILKDRMINLDNQPYEEEADNGDGLNPEPAEPKVISYLFKRDQWDSNQKWYPYYLKLSEICRRGIPPQLRKIVWSELSRVCYFIELTERFLAQAELQRKYEAFDPIQKADAGSGKLTKSRLVYDKLCSQASREFYYLYQELEEDIEALREKQGKEKLDYEANLRNICRTFIYWSHLFANIQVEEVKYYVSYSRAIVTLCQGLVIALSCSYLQSEVVVEEDAVFWLLISLTSYILASYYETNEEALSVEVIAAGNNKKPGRKNNKITLSALRCPEMKGIKGDILLLKLLLKELEPEIFYKFEELGLPIEEFFADHMLTLFSTLLNPSLAYRVWDMVFFEGSASNQVTHNFLYLQLLTLNFFRSVVTEWPLSQSSLSLETARNSLLQPERTRSLLSSLNYIVKPKHFLDFLS